MARPGHARRGAAEARAAEDARIVALTDALSEERIGQPLAYRNISGTEFVQPLRDVRDAVDAVDGEPDSAANVGDAK